MSNTFGELEALIQQKLEGDSEFQSTLTDLSDDDKKQKVDARKNELLDSELNAIKEKAERAEKAEELANNYKIRAEKAEREPKTTVTPDGLSSRDVLYLAKADIHTDDVDEVLEYAKKMGVSIAKAHEFYTPILDTRAKERKSAAATNTKGSARGTAKESAEDILEKAEKGEVLESDSDMQKLFSARIARKIRKR